MTDGPPQLRPGFLDVINEAFDLSRRCAGPCIAASAVVYLPIALLFPYVLAADLFAAMPILATVVTLVLGLLLTAGNGAMLLVWIDRSLGKERSAAVTWRLVLRRLPFYLLTSVLASGVAFIRCLWWTVATFMLMDKIKSPNIAEDFAAVGVIGWSALMSVLWFHFLWAVMLEENVRFVAAVRRASRLLSGHWRRVAAFALLALLSYVLVVVVVMLVVGTVLATLERLLRGVTSADVMGWFGTSEGIATFFYLAALAVTPLTLVLTVLLYIDVRVRKEALDLEWIIAGLTGESDGDAPVSAG